MTGPLDRVKKFSVRRLRISVNCIISINLSIIEIHLPTRNVRAFLAAFKTLHYSHAVSGSPGKPKVYWVSRVQNAFGWLDQSTLTITFRGDIVHLSDARLIGLVDTKFSLAIKESVPDSRDSVHRSAKSS